LAACDLRCATEQALHAFQDSEMSRPEMVALCFTFFGACWDRDYDGAEMLLTRMQPPQAFTSLMAHVVNGVMANVMGDEWRRVIALWRPDAPGGPL
jgi:hypothetical protein